MCSQRGNSSRSSRRVPMRALQTPLPPLPQGHAPPKAALPCVRPRSASPAFFFPAAAHTHVSLLSWVWRAARVCTALYNPGRIYVGHVMSSGHRNRNGIDRGHVQLGSPPCTGSSAGLWPRKPHTRGGGRAWDPEWSLMAACPLPSLSSPTTGLVVEN